MREAVKRLGANPCAVVWGPGPADRTCADCALLRVVNAGRRYFKCGLRVHTSGPGSDHRLSWPTCARFQEVGEGDSPQDHPESSASSTPCTGAADA